jgi:LuxR family maltose regulon positive regulatory protein
LGNHQEAEKLLSRLSASTGERLGSRIIILTLLAAACKEQPSLADQYLEEALRLAEPEGYIRTFLNMGNPLWTILKSWLNHQPENDDESLKSYAYKIILAFEANTNIRAESEKENILPETLSQRELEVLQLVAEGLTNQQIATRLVISIRTVKKHIENIHGKLGVKNRTQATTRARSLGLLDPS